MRLLAAALAALAVSAHAALGMMELPANAVSGPVTVFYPAQASAAAVRRGVFTLEAAADAVPAATSSRLIVISHGSPGSPWVHLDLVRALVDAGFTVALPEHQGDNYKDDSEPGPPAWRRRPLEVSRAIDRLAHEPAFATRLDFSHVGMFGMSAGGHTALTLAGGRWSPSRLRDHCRKNLADDFSACAGPSVALTGGVFDGAKKLVVQIINDRKFDDASWYGHVDSRIVAVVAGVPFAADFDPESLRQPQVALALISAAKDRWLVPKFHSDAIAAACGACERLMNVETGGHGALLGPLPPSGGFDLVADPPGFDRATQVPLINKAITRFFQKTLPGTAM
ncbi:dienelactone hydrolase [Caenimonas koreensis DSM 17982]|uniref:Dienelactone hydrolase n=1 Tax=Caenimonas koreensis DSM 17982 TaxID=1121255 RepID=A0A844B8M6_9BURK|nr:dienelactone hydrolase [Caenimonas koreensis]MRD47959.1 dienelactone hydrolase [Caenimonas koreensis DSM 17982]